MSKPLMFDLFCGLGGATAGFLAEGWHCIGIDNERHRYGDHCYPSQLWIQDILTVDGAQLRDADFLWASPPCQKYSYMAMPWKRGKAKAAAIRADATGAELERLNALFNACFRIQREACQAAGRHIPLIVENVRGAQPWVGRARWSFGSFYLWGDVPALMPVTKREFKVGGTYLSKVGFNVACVRKFSHGDPNISMDEGRKNTGGSWFAVAHNTTSGKGRNPDGRKNAGPKWDPATKSGAHGMSHWTNPAEGTKCGGDWFNASQPSISRMTSSKSPARKMASAMIAKIPEPLSRHIARTFYPRQSEAAE